MAADLCCCRDSAAGGTIDRRNRRWPENGRPRSHCDGIDRNGRRRGDAAGNAGRFAGRGDIRSDPGRRRVRRQQKKRDRHDRGVECGRIQVPAPVATHDNSATPFCDWTDSLDLGPCSPVIQAGNGDASGHCGASSHSRVHRACHADRTRRTAFDSTSVALPQRFCGHVTRAIVSR